MTSQEIVEELQQLEQQLAALRAREKEEEVAFSELEGQVHELSGKLALMRREISDFEGLLTAKRTEIAKIEYEHALQAREEAGAQLAEAISQVLAGIDIYNRAQQAVAAVKVDPDTRDATRNAQADPEIVTDLWERLISVVQERGWHLTDEASTPGPVSNTSTSPVE